MARNHSGGLSTGIPADSKSYAAMAGRIAWILSLAAGFGPWISMATADVVYRRVALTNDPVPGEEGTAFYHMFHTDSHQAPSISSQGRAVFVATVLTPDGARTRLYIESDDGVEQVAERSQQASGTPEGVTFKTMDWATANNTGQVAFMASLQGPGVGTSNDRGIWYYDGTELRMVMRESSPVGDHMPGYTYGTYLSGLRHEGDYVSFMISLSGTGYSGYAIFAGTPNLPEVVAKRGDAAPGMPDGTVFTTFLVNGSNWGHQLNANGEVAFRATVEGPTVPQQRAIWMGARNGLQLVAAHGLPAPDVEPGAEFYTSYSEPGLNTSGQIAFLASIIGTDVGGHNRGVWAGEPDNLRAVIRREDPIYGMPEGVSMTFDYGWPPVLNSAGGVAFAAKLYGEGVTSGNQDIICVETDDGLKVAAREGDSHPSLPDGVTFGSFVAEPLTNGRGQVAFASTLRGTGLPWPKNNSLWLTDTQGVAHLVASPVVLFEVAPGDDRSVYDLWWTVNSGGGGEDGRSCALNDRGELIFAVKFTEGGNGVFVASIDEPTALEVEMQVKPGSCPNPLNPKSRGKLPVALFGTDAFDVSQIDLTTLALSRADAPSQGVSPLEGPPGPRSVIEDIGAPAGGEPCDCNDLPADGIDDLVMKFDTPDLTATLGLDDPETEAIVELVLSGSLLDGTPFTARDCIWLVPPADFDQDSDVDQADFGHFQKCVSGPGVPVSPGCEAADLDQDGDADLSDFAVFQGCLNGAGIAANPNCVR